MTQTPLCLQLGGGPHRTDVFELFPATFQVKLSSGALLHLIRTTSGD